MTTRTTTMLRGITAIGIGIGVLTSAAPASAAATSSAPSRQTVWGYGDTSKIDTSCYDISCAERDDTSIYSGPMSMVAVNIQVSAKRTSSRGHLNFRATVGSGLNYCAGGVEAMNAKGLWYEVKPAHNGLNHMLSVTVDGSAVRSHTAYRLHLNCSAEPLERYKVSSRVEITDAKTPIGGGGLA